MFHRSKLEIDGHEILDEVSDGFACNCIGIEWIITVVLK